MVVAGNLCSMCFCGAFEIDWVSFYSFDELFKYECVFYNENLCEIEISSRITYNK